MFSYAHGNSESPLLDETIGSNFERTVHLYPDSAALVSRHQGRRFTYSGLDEAVNRVALGLMAYGLERGDRIGIWSHNYSEWVLVQHATANIGAILVNLNPAYRAAELEYTLSHSGCKFLIAAPQFKDSSCVAMVDQVRPNLSSLERPIFMFGHDWDALLAASELKSESDLRERMDSLEFDDPINIQYTSGTTGSPKGATLSYHNILNNGYFVGEYLRCSTNDRVCIPVPFDHCFGMVLGNLATTSHGACIVLPEASFEPNSVLQVVQDESCTSPYGVPTMFIAELAHPNFFDYDLGTLRTGIMAGSLCPVEVMKRVIDDMHMEQVSICYGMTETSPVSTQTTAEDPIERPVASVGQVHPHVEIKIADPETGNAVSFRSLGSPTRGLGRRYWSG